MLPSPQGQELWTSRPGTVLCIPQSTGSHRNGSHAISPLGSLLSHLFQLWLLYSWPKPTFSKAPQWQHPIFQRTFSLQDSQTGICCWPSCTTMGHLPVLSAWDIVPPETLPHSLSSTHKWRTQDFMHNYHLSIHSSITHPPIYPSIHISTHLSSIIHYPCTHPSIHPCVYLLWAVLKASHAPGFMLVTRDTIDPALSLVEKLFPGADKSSSISLPSCKFS